jgi:gamma-glutamyl-gamma-aminobutyrate hydrolase PuuD
MDAPPKKKARTKSPDRSSSSSVLSDASRMMMSARRAFDVFRDNLANNSGVSEQQAIAMGVPVYHDPRGYGYLISEPEQRLRPRPTEERQQIASGVSRQIEARRDIPRNPLTIAHRDEGRGTGAFWDHYTFQRITDRSTIASVPDNTHADFATHYMAEGKAKGHNYRGALPHEPVTVPRSEGSGHGLLMITGSNYGLESEQPRRSKAHTPSSSAELRNSVRARHEQTLLQEARLSGRPVLAVCGGSWRVLEAFGGQTRQLATKTHQSRQMPYLTKDGKVGGGGNITEHGVNFVRDSVLAGAMRDRKGTLPDKVNSVHWAAADEVRPGELAGVKRYGVEKSWFLEPQLLSVTARGVTDTQRPYLGLKGSDLTQRSLHSVEAFETRHGAPMIGVQWHPEAYNASHIDHAANKRLVNFMAQAGDAFEARRAMTREFKVVADELREIRAPVTPSNVRHASVALSQIDNVAPRHKRK